MSNRRRRRDRVHREKNAARAITVHACGPAKDHVCDDKGPGIDTETSSSASCSQCGMSAIDRSMWDGP